jgi:hypothetical protein
MTSDNDWWNDVVMDGASQLTHHQEDESSVLCFLYRSETDEIPSVVGLIAEEHDQY